MRSVQNLSTPTSFGIQWITDGGATLQLAAIPGGRNLIFGVRNGDTGDWMTGPFSEPERLTDGNAIRSFADLRRAAERWASLL